MSVSRTCEKCGEQFECHPCLVQRGGGRYCSKSCANSVSTRARNLAAAPPLMDRFWARVDKTAGPDECWPWTGARHGLGYGHFRIGDKVEKTNRVALAWAEDLDLRAPWFACHRCDSPPCCNPKHLYVGGHQSNAEDMVYRDRQARGEAIGSARLTEADVRALRASAGSLSQLTARFGVSKTAVRNAKSGRTWKYLAAAIVVFAVAMAPAHAYRTASVVDGDTLTVTSGGGTTGYRIRIMGLDAPETRGRCSEETALAARARARLAQLVAPGVTFHTDLDADRYGRLLAQVFTRDGRDVAKVLISEGLAREYHGTGARQPWCVVP